MSTSMVDLSSLQTVNFGNGVTGSYDPSSGTYYDSGGNPLSASDLAGYGAFTVSSPGQTGPAPVTPPPGAAAPVSSAGSGAALAGLSGLFSSVGGMIVNATKPTVTTPTGQTLVYNPATGGYTNTVAGLTASSTMNPLILLLIAAGLIFIVMREA